MQISDFKSGFLLADQPTTCPYCGVRTDWYDFTHTNARMQIHFCENKDCSKVLIFEENEQD